MLSLYAVGAEKLDFQGGIVLFTFAEMLTFP